MVGGGGNNMSLPRFDMWVRSTVGPAAAGAQVFLCTQPATVSTNPTPQAQLYSDNAGLVPISQPLVADGFGHVDCYVAAGAYTVVVVYGGSLVLSYPDQAIGIGGLVLPVTLTATSQRYLTGYSSITGIFTAQQPSFSDISGVATSNQLPVMVGDSGSGGVQGAVPAPPAGSAAALKYLAADGTFSVPSGTGIGISSVGLSTNAAFLTIGNSPLTSNGTITANLTTGLTQNYVLATPNGSSGTVGLRSLVNADLPTKTVSINYVIDGGGSTPATGQSYGQITIPIAMTISSVIITADQSGSCQLDLKYCTDASFPGSLTSIVASDPPKLSSQQISTDSTLTGWSKSLAASSQLQFYLTSATTVQRINICLVCTAAAA